MKRMRFLYVILGMILLTGSAPAADRGGKVEYVGGTVAEFENAPKGRLVTVNDRFLVFESDRVHYLVPWEDINLIEYGQKVNRRLLAAALISPVLALSKSRKHFLTIGFADEKGDQQALVFRVSKGDIRSLLVALEAKANLRVEYQDEEARKAGKG